LWPRRRVCVSRRDRRHAGHLGRKEEYSHAYLIQVISLFIAWQQENELARIQFAGSLLGVAIVALGVWFLRLISVSAFLEGNVVDLGSYQLHVAEAGMACNN
jgi:hypothetical protein